MSFLFETVQFNANLNTGLLRQKKRKVAVMPIYAKYNYPSKSANCKVGKRKNLCPVFKTETEIEIWINVEDEGGISNVGARMHAYYIPLVGTFPSFY